MAVNYCLVCKRPCWYKLAAHGKCRSCNMPETSGVGHSGKNGLPEPTDALPGTTEKKAVLRERAEGQFLLHHPLDPNFFEDDDEVP